MNVGLWAEIRRLAEIEKLSARAISRRLHCSRHTVAMALESDRPLARQATRRASRLDPYKAKINALLAKYPELSAVRVREEICAAPTAIRVAPSSFAAISGPSAPLADASTRRSTTSRPRPCRSIGAIAAESSSVEQPAGFRSSRPCSATAG